MNYFPEVRFKGVWGHFKEGMDIQRASLVAQMVESACNVADPGLMLGSGRSPREGNGNPLQYSCQENSMDRGAWRATYCPWDCKELHMTEWWTLSQRRLPNLKPRALETKQKQKKKRQCIFFLKSRQKGFKEEGTLTRSVCHWHHRQGRRLIFSSKRKSMSALSDLQGLFIKARHPIKTDPKKKKKKTTDPTHEYSQVPLTKPLSELTYNYFLLLQRLLIRKISSRNKNLELPPCIPLIPELSRPLLHFNASQFFATAPLYCLSLIRDSTARLNKISEQAFAMSPQ